MSATHPPPPPATQATAPDPPGVCARAARWELRGAGLENLSLREWRVPAPGPRELLVRIDACGICFSDIKVLNLGGEHPRLAGRDLAADPVVMGHETAMTVVRAGEALRENFASGQRFIIQADVYYGGQNLAFGYRLPGGYSQFQIIGEEALAGDEGCYLLPVAGHLGYAQAALCEPWACVEAAYAFRPREFAAQGAERLDVDAAGGGAGQVLARARREHPTGLPAIALRGRPSASLVEAAFDLLAPRGVLTVERPTAGRCDAEVDVGRIHYQGLWLTGAATAGASGGWNRGCDLVPGGTALFIGAGGPLGQMHLQRALALPRPPGKVVIIQRGGPRLDALRERFGDAAARRGIGFVLLDARALGDAVYERARDETDGRGFDDVVTIAPDLTALARGYELVANGGGLNLFAGVPVGSRIRLDLARIFRDGVRIWGTSGSSIADLQRVVQRVGSGELATDAAVAAVGGLGAVAEGLAAVRDGRFLGKTVIYPQLESLPLSTVANLGAQHPSIAALLTDGRLWNRGAEAELLGLYG